MGSSTHFLDVGRKRVAGACASAVLLLAGCTQVVSAHAKPDPVAVSSYMSASSASSAASASASTAAAQKQAVCSAFSDALNQTADAWNNFVTALNNHDPSVGQQANALKDVLNAAVAQLRSANADPGTGIGKAVAAYVAALADLAGIFDKGHATADEMNNSHQKIKDTGQTLSGFCPN